MIRGYIMIKKICVIGLICLMSSTVMTLTANAQEQILGPWLWMIVKLGAGGGSAATDIDSLADASDNAVTEEMVAKNGAKEGDQVGDYQWTLAELPANGDINDVVNATGMDEVEDINHITSYALYTYNSDKAQDVSMKTGSDDSIKVWINGEEVFKNAVNRGRSMWQDEFGISLKQGDNLIMVKISEATGGWGMHVGISETPFVSTVEFFKDWLWMCSRAEDGQGGAAATDVDLLARASNNRVTELKIARNGAIEGAEVGDYKWTSRDLPQDGNLDVIATALGVTGAFEHIGAYGLVVLSSDEAQKVQMLTGSDDSIKVWLNGKEVFKNASNRGRARWQDEFTIDLKQGNNLLMVKVVDATGGWGMHVGIRGTVETVPIEKYQSVEATGKLITTWSKLKGAK